MMKLATRMTDSLNRVGAYLPPLALRLLLAWEFWESGVEKYAGANWFVSIQDKFPFPFSMVPADVSWFLATWFELLGAIALVAGFATRFFSASLVILTAIAWVSVHADNGYNVCDNGFKLPLFYVVMFLPLLFSGPGKLSVDCWIKNWVARWKPAGTKH